MNEKLSPNHFLQQVNVDHAWRQMPSDGVITATMKNLESRAFSVVLVANKKEALATVQKLIPTGASVMNGSSTSLIEIGFVDYLQSGAHSWKNMHDAVLKEQDKQKQAALRKQALLSDYFLGSANAIASTGQIVAADASGSRVGAYLFAAEHLILVAGVNKIAADLPSAMQRVWDFVLPLESQRAKEAYGVPGSSVNKMIIFEREMFKGRVTVVLVKELLGF